MTSMLNTISLMIAVKKCVTKPRNDQENRAIYIVKILSGGCDLWLILFA